MSATAPPPVTFNPLRRIVGDLRNERRATRKLPPGPLSFSVARTRSVARDPLAHLLANHERYGPVFSMRVLHMASVWMLGPEANHFMTVSHADRFHYREGSMGDLIPLIGDALLTLDGEDWKRSRELVMPAFHRNRVEATGATMQAECERALASWRPGAEIHLYDWMRALSLRIAMRALFGLNPDRNAHGLDVAAEFERAFSFYGRDYFLQAARGPGSPWAKLKRSRRRIDRMLVAEIDRRRASLEQGEDILSTLIAAREEDGGFLSDKQVRDQMMTLLFAGHDTATSTVSFLFYELARHPDVAERLINEQDSLLSGRPATAAELLGGALPQLDMVVDEVLRLYPPAWVGARRAVAEFEFAGHTIPAGTPVNYSSWASHRLPEVFKDPDEFVPERFSPDARAKLPKGAYIPFGGGQRICVGMRFGQLEVKAMATAILQRYRLELAPGYELALRQMPTLSPRGGLPMIIRQRG